MNPEQPIFASPPVVKTQLAVQFDAIAKFRAAHIGVFWRDCLGSGWRPVAETEPQPTQVETFETLELNPTPADDLNSAGVFAVQAVFRNNDKDTVLIQPNRLTVRCQRQGGGRTYAEVRELFDPILAKLGELSQVISGRALRPDLWELSYLNVIPQGELWTSPGDWPGVLPGLFTAGPVVPDATYSTFSGDWYFELPDRAGRLRLTASKSVSNRTGKLALLFGIRASGPLASEGPRDWRGGLDLGHEFAVRAFTSLTSEKAKQAWRAA